MTVRWWEATARKEALRIAQAKFDASRRVTASPNDLIQDLTRRLLVDWRLNPDIPNFLDIYRVIQEEFEQYHARVVISEKMAERLRGQDGA